MKSDLKALLILFIVLLLTQITIAQKATLESKEYDKLDSILVSAISNELVPGAVILISQKSQILYQKAYGFAQKYDFSHELLRPPIPMSVKNRFDLASLTKVFATTYGIMLLVDRQIVNLDAPVYKYLPTFRGVHKDSITVRHLLSHSAGIFPWKPIYYHANSAKESYEYICQLPLAFPVGKERHYSDLGFMLLGYIIEKLSGQTIDEFLKHNLYEPLDLKSIGFNPKPEGLPFAATSHGNPFEKRMVADNNFGYLCDEDTNSFQSWRTSTLVGEVNDGNAFHAHEGMAGHAGLFSTASDLQVLLELLLKKGIYNNRRFLSEEVIQKFLTKDAFSHGLGWAMSQDVIPASHLPDGAFGHTGFTGTYVVAFPSAGVSLILLTNRQNLGVNKSGYYNSLTSLRRELTDLVIRILVD